MRAPPPRWAGVMPTSSATGIAPEMSSDDGSSSSSAACLWEFGTLAFHHKVQMVEREGYALIVVPSAEKGGVSRAKQPGPGESTSVRWQ